MKRYIFKIFYIGSNYLGFQRQKNGMGIENFVEYVFVLLGYIESFRNNRYISTSRTDAGVSAIGNVFTLNIINEPNLKQINYLLPRDIIIWDYAEVSLNFNPRIKLSKIYSYILMERIDIEKLKELIGVNNFSKLIKRDGAGRYNPETRIIGVSNSLENDMCVINLEGDNFGRQQIRNMIGFLRDSRLKQRSLKNYLISNDKIDIKPAAPEYLILRSINFIDEISWKRKYLSDELYFLKIRINTERSLPPYLILIYQFLKESLI